LADRGQPQLSQRNEKSIGGYFAHRFISFQIQSTAVRGRQPE
jgi:hypothetical protein